MKAMSCPNCVCVSCVQERATEDSWRRSYAQQAGLEECAYVRIAREYAERGETMPAGMLLHCGCRRCSPLRG